MTDYLCGSLLWSGAGFSVGVFVGIAISDHVKNLVAKWRQTMTTPERLKRRQRIEGVALILLGVVTIAWAVQSDSRDDSQDACVQSFIQDQADTQQIRSGLVEQESEATRKVISSALSAGSRAEIEEARTEYSRSLQEIDQVRRENPVAELDPDLCDR